MIVLTIVLLILGTLMFMEGSTTIFFPQYSLKILKKFNKSTEKHFKIWGIAEMILALAIITIALLL